MGIMKQFGARGGKTCANKTRAGRIYNGKRGRARAEKKKKPVLRRKNRARKD